jgi:hypothetical protein
VARSAISRRWAQTKPTASSIRMSVICITEICSRPAVSPPKLRST